MNQALYDAAQTAMNSWHGTHEYHQAAMIIQMLLDEIDKLEDQLYQLVEAGE